MKNHWSEFWKQGHATTFGPYYKEGYRGVIGDWWEVLLAQMQPGESVLDLGCGNAALLVNLLEKNNQIRYLGLDLAEVRISPVAQVQVKNLVYPPQLFSNCPAEKIPLENASIDAVVSVFGIEYSQCELTLGEVSRVLKNEGRLDLLVHHSESNVTRMSKKAVDEYKEEEIESLLQALQTIHQVIVSDGVKGLKASAVAENSRSLVNSLASKYLNDTDLQTANGTMFEFLNHALQFFKLIQKSEQDRSDFITNLRVEFQAYKGRFQEMVSVAKDESGIHEFQGLCKQAGMEVLECKEIYDEKGLLAWQLAGKK